MIINIDKEIEEQRKQKNHDSSNYVESLKEFKSLSNVESYLFEDAECFWEIDCYVKLIEELKELTGINIDNLSANDEDGIWTFDYTLDGKSARIEMADPETDWLTEDFMLQFNEQLMQAGFEKEIYPVLVGGINRMDQCVNMIYTDEATHEVLQNHPERYAFNLDDEF